MTDKFRPAPEAEAIAKRLIREHHRHLHRQDVRIDYIFAGKLTNKNGRVTLAKAEKVSGKTAFLARFNEEGDEGDGSDFFTITFSRIEWCCLDERQQIALVDHELCHLWAEDDEKTDELKLSLLPHDIEEFGAIVERHGLWKQDVANFVKIAANHQTYLEFDAPRSDGRRWGGGIESITVSVDGKAPVTTTPEALADHAERALLRDQPGA